jgi:PAS domain S-box-containing protein
VNGAASKQEYLKTLTVLCVEDDEFSRELCRALLSPLVGALITADDGAQGLEAYKKYLPDIVVTDIQMPVLDGLAMVQQIRDLAGERPAAIFVMTAFDQIDYLKQSINLGALEYVTKPIAIDTFTESLLECAHRLLIDRTLHRTQNELVVSRNMYAELYDSAPVAYFTFDPAGVILETNITGAQLLGAERGALIGGPFSAFLAGADDRALFARYLESVLQSEGMQRCDLRLSGAGGALLHGQLQSVAVGSVQGGNAHILCSVVDGTAGKQLEAEIQEARQYAENIVETVREPLVVLDSDLKILTANHSFYKTFHVTPGQTVGNFIYDIGNRQWDIPALRVLFEEILPGNTVFNGYEVEHDFPGVGRKVMLLNARKIYRGGSGSRVILLAMEDVTARKQAEAALRENGLKLQSFNEDLEKRIAQEVFKNREKDVILLHNDKMSSIGQLAAGVAHEINNPMAFIASNLVALKGHVAALGQFHALCLGLAEKNCSEGERQLLQEESRRLDIEFVLEDIGPLIAESSEGADRVKQIVADLKGFARSDDSSIEPADLNACVRSTVNIVRNEIKYVADLELQLGEIPLIYCSRHQISQVVINLLVNAAHSIDHHGSIAVTTRREGESVLLSVRDTGHGMSEAVRNRIFEPFFTTKEVGKGTGLGLSVSYSIIKKHGGEILVESLPGEGTTFTVRLPIENPKEVPA